MSYCRLTGLSQKSIFLSIFVFVDVQQLESVKTLRRFLVSLTTITYNHNPPVSKVVAEADFSSQVKHRE